MPDISEDTVAFLMAVNDLLPEQMSRDQMTATFCFILEAYKVPLEALPALFEAMISYRKAHPVPSPGETFH